jgi:signal transduction histidine kinase
MNKPIANNLDMPELFKLVNYMAHEMQNPLATINIESMNLSHLVDRLNNLAITSEQRADMQEIAGSIKQEANYLVHYLRTLVNNLKALTLDTIEIENVLLDECIKECLAIFPFCSQVARDSIQTMVENHAQVVGNKFWLKHIINNLLDNAIYHVQQAGKGSISLEISEKDNSHQLIITDTGMGIAEERLESIFEPFTTTSPNHLGLGLAASRRLIERFGGAIYCHSSLGELCQFTIRLNNVAK